MPYGPLEEFKKSNEEDIETADKLIRDYIIPSGEPEHGYLASTMIDWFIQIDVPVLRDRARVMEHLATTYGPYSYIFGPPYFGDAKDGWSGKGADAFYRYCEGRSNAEFSFLHYINAVHQSAIDHYQALTLGDGAGGLIEALEAAQNDFYNAVSSNIGGLTAKRDNAWSIFGWGTTPADILEYVFEVYKAAVNDTILISDASGAVAARGKLLTGGYNVSLDQDRFGPTDTEALDGLTLEDGAWRPG